MVVELARSRCWLTRSKEKPVASIGEGVTGCREKEGALSHQWPVIAGVWGCHPVIWGSHEPCIVSGLSQVMLSA